MISALFYLQINSIRNRLRARLGRLKHPKYLIGAIIGGAYFIFYFSWLVIMPGRGGAGSLLAGAADLGGAQNIGAAILLVVVVAGWVLPNERAALAFSEAEVAFLFPAPITRRGLLHYKLVRSQLGILFSTLFLTLIFGRWRYGGHAWISVLGWWVILSTLNLHLLAFSFARTILFDRGLTNWRRRALILTGLVVAIGVVGVTSWRSWPALPETQSPGDLWRWLGALLSTGATPYLLLPFRLVVAPYFAPDAWSFFLALIPALAILALHYILVMRADVAFEEASVAYSQKLATRIAAAREWRGRGLTPTKARRAPFPLAPVGLPSVAFLWKNLILAGSLFSPRMLLRLGVIGFVVVMMMHLGQGNSDAAHLAGVLCFMLFIMSMFIGQNLLRMDFRMDIRLMDQLKLYPLPGWQVVLGELLAPVVILTVVQWLLILAAASLLAPDAGPSVMGAHQVSITVTNGAGTDSVPAAVGISLGLRVGLALAAALLAPAVDLIMLIIPNAVALVMPSWVRFDKNAPRGIENFGQNIILVFGQMMVLLVAVLPAGLIFWLVFFLVGLLIGPAVALPLGAVAGAGVLASEGACAIYFLGHAFEHFDLSAELTN